jgi:hypothetical protein
VASNRAHRRSVLNKARECQGRLEYVSGYKMSSGPVVQWSKVWPTQRHETTKARRYVQPVVAEQTQLQAFSRLSDVAQQHR